MLKVLIGIPTYNGAHRVDWLLQSISMRTDKAQLKFYKDIDYKIIVCDDSGKKDHQEKTVNVVNKWKSSIPVDIIINDKNLGLAASWNRIVKSQDSEYVILINDDIIVANDWLETMTYFLDKNQKAGAVSHFCYFITNDDIPQLLSSLNATVKPRDPFTKVPTGEHSDQNEHPGRVMAPAGCLFAFRREIYNEIGGFDENYRVFYEESDFGTNLASHGYPCYVLCYPRNWHLWSATFGNAPEIRASEVMNDSRQYYIKKWNGHFEVTHPRYMDKIPFQKIKWLYKDKTCEDMITSDHGYHDKLEK